MHVFKWTSSKRAKETSPQSTQLTLLLADLPKAKLQGTLLLVFVPATLDFSAIVRTIESQFSHIPVRFAIQTAGQVGGSSADFYNLQNSERILLHALGKDLFESVEVFMVDTLCGDLQKGKFLWTWPAASKNLKS
ncbi:hypothetical protein [Helicobacter heilmannii]|uniref:hypothetical protein n=1 Tax=Helicobacter heilmannii TaxID=35817 RepID=UPI0012E1EC23|nr:hypothetical protein [Helicobacter heilmannii]